MARSTKGEATRQRILEAAQDLILERGYSGISVDNVIEKVGMTKGAFFHHYRNKGDMARALMRRFAEDDRAHFEDCLARAEKLSTDPLQQMLIMIGLYEEMFTGLSEPYPGCLMASYIYELQMFDDDIIDIINESFRYSRSTLVERFKAVAQVYPPRHEVDFDALADQFLVLIEGAFILSKSLNEPAIVLQQLQLYKNTLELLFAPGDQQAG